MWPHRPREDLLDALSGRKRQRGGMVRTGPGCGELGHPGRQGGPARVDSIPQSVTVNFLYKKAFRNGQPLTFSYPNKKVEG